MSNYRLSIVALIVFASALTFASIPMAQSGVYLGVRHVPSSDPPGMLLSVILDSPGFKGGLRTGDVAIALGGVPVGADGSKYAAMLADALSGKSPGDKLKVKVIRSGPVFDIKINGASITLDFPLQELPDLILNSKPGDKIDVVSKNEKRELEFEITLGPRPEGGRGKIPPNSELFPNLPAGLSDVRKLIDVLVDETGTREQYEDLKSRLDGRATPDDGFRLPLVSYLLRDGLQGEAAVRDISLEMEIAASEGIAGARRIHRKITRLMNAPFADFEPAYPPAQTADRHIEWLKEVLFEAARLSREAFADFTPDEIAFLERTREGLTEVFKEENYIDSDENPKRFRDNVRLIELARRVNYSKLMQAQAVLLQIADDEYLTRLRGDLMAAYADTLANGVLYEEETPLGWIVIQGAGRTWRNLPTDPAQYRHDLIVIDLGGDDFYSTRAGGGFSQEFPVGVLIDFDGNDAYESTLHYSQGSGSMGCGLLIDAAGDDSYIGTQWAQGTGFLGCGALIDAAGDDSYRGHEFTQSAAIFGSSFVYEISGGDRMDAHAKSQAFGGARSVALLVDVEGSDSRYAKGTYATGYGDPGIFDAWSQGCGDGFRQYASGGIAGIIDFGGDDYFEAGNFATGGGYYYGFGFVHNAAGNDRYVGSRYNQGFCAHQAVGVFLDDAGDDIYDTRQGVAQGLAWDECATIFIDGGGDDVYHGGTGFSQGASAHNAICVFWDKGGDDVYDYPPGQARAGGNDYHGGTSLSIFIDSGGGRDLYNWNVSAVIPQTAPDETSGEILDENAGDNLNETAGILLNENAGEILDENGETISLTDAAPPAGNNLITGWPEYGFFCDLPGDITDSLKNDAWKGIYYYKLPL